tara:strand:- start:87 stop:557 length:471 start_codon:yes stop_codon:yes gene_type:complete
MGVRSNSHQLVGGLQYFDSDVQVEGALQGHKQEVITATDGMTLTAEQSGAIVVVGDNIDINLPTAAEGLNYKFVANADIGSDTSKITAPVADTMFGAININGTPTKVANVHIATFKTASDEGDWFEIVCVSSSTSATDPVWHITGAGAAASSIGVV